MSKGYEAMPDAATTTYGNGGGQVRKLVEHDQGLGLDGKGVMVSGC